MTLALTVLADVASHAIEFNSLGLDPVIFRIGFFSIKWYSLAYLAGILLGYWYLTVLIRQPGAPMARRHVDDFVFYATLGIILGGRIGYVLFYHIDMLATPSNVFKLWEGGMSLHGGTLGVLIAIWWMTRREGISFLRFCDYVACATPFGLCFGRLANFVNGELWGKVTDVPWAIIFPTGGSMPRHPSQLYEAALEGPVMFAILALFFWKTNARYQPGKLVGIGALTYGCARFFVEFFREADSQFEGTFLYSFIHMGQILSLPMILIGLYLIATAKGRRLRVEPVAGNQSVS